MSGLAIALASALIAPHIAAFCGAGPKPRLKRVARCGVRIWCCQSQHALGTGATPADAYEAWLFDCGELDRHEREAACTR